MVPPQTKQASPTSDLWPVVCLSGDVWRSQVAIIPRDLWAGWRVHTESGLKKALSFQPMERPLTLQVNCTKVGAVGNKFSLKHPPLPSAWQQLIRGWDHKADCMPSASAWKILTQMSQPPSISVFVRITYVLRLQCYPIQRLPLSRIKCCPV